MEFTVLPHKNRGWGAPRGQPSTLNSAIIELMYGHCQEGDVMGVCGGLSIPGRLKEAAWVIRVARKGGSGAMIYWVFEALA